ncbi:hypothetical protein E4T56_gene10826 [Termitomyces sp. T112]|nr:hypothetical protein E4T56_gene10826 [Termitomyces sp. T112]
MIDLVLCYQDHSEQAAFAITSLGKQDMILGFTWLCEHNPEIDWTKEEAHKEQKAKVCEHAAMHACHAGHLPYADLDLLSLPPLAFPYREALYEDVQGVRCEPLEEEEGEEEWTSTLDPEFPDETIEVENSQPKPFHNTIPNHLNDFEDVFSKASFDSLPEHKQWDHAIELIPDARPFSCKVYLLAPYEQDELDTFLQENFSSGQIQPSKSPMASPVFFIKKKDGSLHLVQNYCVSNVMMLKNHYPLPLISELINNLQGACYFTKLDICWGYNNIHIKEGDEWKAAF